MKTRAASAPIPGAFGAPGGSNCSGVVSERSRLDCVTPACSQQRRERVWAWLSLSEGSHVPVWKKLSRGAPFGVPCTGRRNLSLGAVLLTCRRGVRAPWCRVGAPCSRACRVCACPDVCYVQKSVVRALPSLSSETGGVVVRHEASRAQRRYLVDPASSICLSQRLSHACLSTSLTKVKPRMAH